MWIKSVYLYNFRNYSTLALQLHPGLNILIGDNAQGKTNFLEAVYVLSLTKSYRANRDAEMIKHSASQGVLRARVQRTALLDLAVTVSRTAPKKLEMNQKFVNANSFIGQLNTVLFTPDSLQLIKGSPGERRRFLDVQICQIDPFYRRNLLQYGRVLRQRNSLLKKGFEKRHLLSQLPAWDRQLVEIGSKIIVRRQKALAVLNELGNQMHKTISGLQESLSIRYQPFFGSGEEQGDFSLEAVQTQFFREMEGKKQEEIRRGYTLVGPQRDDFVFFINGADARIFGSQGQQRTAVLSFILAEMELMNKETGEYPVILLDDVMSELDQVRRSFLLSILNKKAQTIITTTNPASFEQVLGEQGFVFHIRSGKIL